jgi:acyl-CoA thioesterase-1
MFIRFLLVTIIGLVTFQDEKTIIFYGDSLTAGYGLAPENAFPALIDEMLGEQGLDYKVVNAGVSGETSSGGLTRIDWILNQKVDIFVLELGANDGLRGIPTAQTYENLTAIIKKVKEKNPECEIVVAGMMVPPNMGADYANQFSEIFPSLAKNTGATLMPFLLVDVAGDPALNLPDGIHPNIQGHKIVANNLMSVLAPLL